LPLTAAGVLTPMDFDGTITMLKKRSQACFGLQARMKRNHFLAALIALNIIAASLLWWGCAPGTRHFQSGAEKNAGSSLTAASQVPWPHEHSDLAPDPGMHFGRLSNGLRYVVIPNQKPPGRVSMHLLVQAGSLNETENERGLAHFLEHMAFDGSTHYPPGELVKYFQRIGMNFGPDANAHTAFAETVYDILLPRGDEAHFREGLKVMRDFAAGALLLPEEIEKERGVIEAERRSRDSADYRTYEASVNFEYPDLLLPRRLPIGLSEVVAAADQNRLKGFYDAWYRPEKMVLVAVGDLDPAAVEEWIKADLGSMRARAAARPEPVLGILRHEGVKTFYHFEPEEGATTVTIEVLHSKPHIPDSAALQQSEILNLMALMIVQNRLDARQQEAEPPFTDAGIGAGRYLREIEYATILAHTPAARWEETLTALEQTLRRALTYGFTAQELERVRKDLLVGLQESLKTAENRESKDIARRLIRHLGMDRVMQNAQQEWDLYAPVVENATADQLKAAFSALWDQHHRLVMVTGNVDLGREQMAPTTLIKKRYLASRDRKLAPPENKVALTFPYQSAPETRGSIRSRNRIEDLGIEQVLFDNGLRLNMKVTDFAVNEVGFDLVFGYGRRNEPTAATGLGYLAEDIVNESGLGTLNRNQLETALAGTTTRVGFDVGEDSFSLDGESVTTELELLFQLLRAHLSDPGFRASAHRLALEQFEQEYRHALTSIDSTLGLEGMRFLAGGDTRFGWPPHPKDLSYLTLAQVEGWVKDAMKGPLELSLVGDFDPKVVIALAARYLGTLPLRTEASPLTMRPDPRFPKSERLDLTVATQIEKSMVVVSFATTDMWDIERTRRLNALADLFTERLRIEIREKWGVSYSPFAFHRTSRIYKGYGFLQVMVSVSPEEADRMVAAVKAIAADLGRSPAGEDELKRIVHPTTSRIRDMRETNGYWLGNVLSGCQRYPQQLAWTRTIVDSYGSISAAELQALAKTYLKGGDAAVIVISPEK
jgi:zinc protease